MTVLSDLHTHSTASDGQYTPSQVVELAKKAGIQVLALTDHDTVDGIPEAMESGKKENIQIIPGIELSAKEYHNFHILGYQYDLSAPHLRALAQKMVDSRNERKYRIIDYLREKGVELSLEEVEEIAGGNIIARPHFAQAMVRRGYVENNRQAFDRYLDTPDFQKIERFRPDVRTCIDAIHADGGSASWAHPYQTGLDFDQVAELAKKLTDWGLDAMECHYNRHTPEQTEFYCRLTEQLGIHITGGSDFHGEKVKPDIRLTPRSLDITWLMERKGENW